MTHRDFCYWLKGFEEINGGHLPTEKQWKVIQEHLAICFNCEPQKTEQFLTVDCKEVITGPARLYNAWYDKDQGAFLPTNQFYFPGMDTQSMTITRVPIDMLKYAPVASC